MAENDNMKTEEEESHLVMFARQELDSLLKGLDKDSESYEMQKLINDDILEMVKTFSKQGHSGFSASYALNILKKLLDWKPIGPLTGKDDEWVECGRTKDNGKKKVFQNRRCSAVFKDVDAETGESVTRYIYKYTISDNGGITWFTSRRVVELLGLSEEISFPFNVPEKSEKIYIKYTEDVPLGETSDNFVNITGKLDEISELRKIYDRKFHPERYEE